MVSFSLGTVPEATTLFVAPACLVVIRLKEVALVLLRPSVQELRFLDTVQAPPMSSAVLVEGNERHLSTNMY